MRSLAALILGLVAAAPVTANYYEPDSSGTPLAVHAEWQDLDWTASTSDFNFLFAEPNDVQVSPDSPVGNAEFNDQAGAYALFQDDWMMFQLPNWIDEEPLKKMRIRLRGDFTTSGDWWQNWELKAAADSAHPDIEPELGPIEGGVGENGWVYADLEIRPNPDWELLRLFDIPDGTYVNTMTVDTVSIPEPGTLTLAGLGTLLIGFFVIRRRRR